MDVGTDRNGVRAYFADVFAEGNASVFMVVAVYTAFGVLGVVCLFGSSQAAVLGCIQFHAMGGNAFTDGNGIFIGFAVLAYGHAAFHKGAVVVIVVSGYTSVLDRVVVYAASAACFHHDFIKLGTIHRVGGILRKKSRCYVLDAARGCCASYGNNTAYSSASCKVQCFAVHNSAGIGIIQAFCACPSCHVSAAITQNNGVVCYGVDIITQYLHFISGYFIMVTDGLRVCR